MRFYRSMLCSLALTAALHAQSAPPGVPPKTWIDPDTGHRVVRLTDEPGSASLYFNQNGYTPDGKKLVYTTPTGISTFNLETHAVKQIVEGRVRLIEVGHKTPSVFYTKGPSVFVTNIDTGATREIAQLPQRGSVVTVNADEPLLAGTYTEAQGPAGNAYASPVRPAQSEQSHPLDQPPNKGQMMEERLAAHIPMGMFVMNTATGEV